MIKIFIIVLFIVVGELFILNNILSALQISTEVISGIFNIKYIAPFFTIILTSTLTSIGAYVAQDKVSQKELNAIKEHNVYESKQAKFYRELENKKSILQKINTMDIETKNEEKNLLESYLLKIRGLKIYNDILNSTDVFRDENFLQLLEIDKKEFLQNEIGVLSHYLMKATKELEIEQSNINLFSKGLSIKKDMYYTPIEFEGGIIVIINRYYHNFILNEYSKAPCCNELLNTDLNNQLNTIFETLEDCQSMLGKDLEELLHCINPTLEKMRLESGFNYVYNPFHEQILKDSSDKNIYIHIYDLKMPIEGELIFFDKQYFVLIEKSLELKIELLKKEIKKLKFKYIKEINELEKASDLYEK